MILKYCNIWMVMRGLVALFIILIYNLKCVFFLIITKKKTELFLD